MIIKRLNIPLIPFAILVISVLFLGCGKSRKPIFEINLEAEFPIQAGLNTLETHFQIIRNVPTFYQSSLSTNGFSVEDDFSVGAGRGLITAKFSDIDYDFLSRISVRVVSRQNPEVSKEMFYLDQISLNQGPELKMLSSIAEIKDIIAEEFIDLEVRFNLRNFSPQAVDNILAFSYAVYESE